MLKVAAREEKGVRIVEVRGKLNQGIGDDPDLARALALALEARVPRLLVDLTGVEAIDTAGICQLVGAKKRVVDKGGSMRIVLPAGKTARKVIIVTQLHTWFGACDTVEEALEAFEA